MHARRMVDAQGWSLALHRGWHVAIASQGRLEPAFAEERRIAFDFARVGYRATCRSLALSRATTMCSPMLRTVPRAGLPPRATRGVPQ